MASSVSLVPNSISVILNGIKLWRDARSMSKVELANKEEAIHQVMLAAVSTKAYLYDLCELESSSRDKERELAKSWQNAAASIYRYDTDLFNSSKVKSLGWADPREWERAKDKAVTVDLDKIIEQCEWLLENLKN